MNPLIHWMVNGSMFLVGCGALGASAFFGLGRAKWAVLSCDLLLALGVVMVGASAEALPMWFYAAWAAAIAGGLVARSKRMAAQRWVRRVGLALPVVACIVAIALALGYRMMPDPSLDRTRRVFVVGDSISAGMGSHGPMGWPAVLQRDYGVDVTNLAVPGARLQSALAQGARVQGEDCVVILEIGGNDMLAEAQPADFQRDLEALIASVESPRRTLVMLELPLLPLANPYGLAQRRTAKAHGIIFVPRRVLADVMAAPGATNDGLHLSEQGDKLLADELAKLFREAWARDLVERLWREGYLLHRPKTLIDDADKAFVELLDAP